MEFSLYETMKPYSEYKHFKHFLILDWIGKYSAMFRRKVAERTDERVRSMNEIVMAMRVIKMYAWEKPFAALINRLRRLVMKCEYIMKMLKDSRLYNLQPITSTHVSHFRFEVKALRKRAYLRAAYQSMFNSSGKLVLFLTVLIFILSGNSLSADKVFFAAAIFNIMMQNMVYVIPSAAAGLGEIFVALSRVEVNFMS
jgi:ATP-binding cassette subfamily C (CFTR/MRP) protein 4